MRKPVFAGRTTDLVSTQISKNAPQILGRYKQNKAGTPEKGCPPSGQTRNPSVVFLWSNEKSPPISAVIFLKLVDSKGIEPSTSAMRTQRSPS